MFSSYDLIIKIFEHFKMTQDAIVFTVKWEDLLNFPKIVVLTINCTS